MEAEFAVGLNFCYGIQKFCKQSLSHIRCLSSRLNDMLNGVRRSMTKLAARIFARMVKCKTLVCQVLADKKLQMYQQLIYILCRKLLQQYVNSILCINKRLKRKEWIFGGDPPLPPLRSLQTNFKNVKKNNNSCPDPL